MREPKPENFNEHIIKLALQPEWQDFMILLSNFKECCKEELTLVNTSNREQKDTELQGEYYAYQLLSTIGKVDTKKRNDFIRGVFTGFCTVEAKINSIIDSRRKKKKINELIERANSSALS